MTLKQMTYFLSVSYTNNLTHSAAELFVSQPTLSLVIKNLEEEVGEKLFDRFGNRMVLTEAGRLLQSDVQSVVDQYRALEKRVQYGILKENTVKVGVSPLSSITILPKICGAMRVKYPDVVMELVESDGPMLLNMLEQNRLDAVITGELYESKEHFLTEKLQEVKYSYYVSRKSTLAEKERVEIDEIVNYPTVMMRAPYSDSMIARGLLLSAAKPFHIAATVDQLLTVRNLIAEDFGGGFLPDPLFANDEALTAVRCVELAALKNYTPRLYWNKSEALNEALEKLIEIAVSLRTTE